MMNDMMYLGVQILVTLIAAPLVNGIIKKVKAFSQKRQGASIFQMYFDIYKLIRKSCVVSETASWVFRATPYIVLSTSLAAALLVPVTTKIIPGRISGDFIILISILALGRFFLMAAALDTGSTFGGMGSSREAMISSLIEPSILVSLFALGLIAHSTSLVQIMMVFRDIGVPLVHPVFLMIFLSLFIVLIAETARIPVDDPSTHLELTMVHEAMILEYSGRHLALVEYAAAVKQLTLMTLLVNVLLPHDQFIAFSGLAALPLSLLVYFGKIVLLSLIMAVFEVNTVKFRLFSIPNLAALSFILSFLGVLQYFFLGGSHV